MLPAMDLAELTRVVENDATPVLRTDRSDDAAWARLVDAVLTPVDTTGDGDPSGLMAPNIVPLDDPSYEGATGESLAAAVESAGDLPTGYALLADAQSMAEASTGGVATLVYVDLSCADPEDAELFGTFMGRSFRCAIPEIASIEVNLSIANLDFSDFADYADERGGVFLGFAEGD